MSYATGTTHYNLPQTVGTDKRDWTDTNEAFSAVDTALYGAVQDAETATSGIQTLNTAVDTINGKLATDEGNISTLSGKVSTLESTVSGHTSAIADVRSDLQDNIESHKEASATSTHAYSIGDTFYYNDILYRATTNIGVGDTIVPNTNCTGITVMSEIQSQTVPTAAQISYDNTSSGLTADDVQEAIDELATPSIGAWTELNGNVSYIRSGNVVSVRAIGESTAYATYTSLGILPEAIRPKFNINTCCRQTVNENYQIDTSGNVNILAPDAVSRYGTIMTYVLGS